MKNKNIKIKPWAIGGIFGFIFSFLFVVIFIYTLYFLPKIVSFDIIMGLVMIFLKLFVFTYQPIMVLEKSGISGLRLQRDY